MEDGSYTLKKRSALPSSSAINWASMFMGAGPELHGYTEWGSKTRTSVACIEQERNLPDCIPIAARRPSGSRNRLPLRMGRYQIFSGHPFSELSLSCCRLQQNSQRIRQYGISLYKEKHPTLLPSATTVPTIPDILKDMILPPIMKNSKSWIYMSVKLSRL